MKRIFLVISVVISIFGLFGNLYAHTMLPTSGPDPGYEVVTTSSGKRTALKGTGAEINNYIADKIKEAGSGDIIRLNIYIITHTANTAYFYDALVTALGNGAKIEIISEIKQRTPGEASEGRIRDQTEFLYGDGTGPAGIIHELVGPGGSIDVYECDHGCDSPNGIGSSTINHSKISLLDINGERDIIITSANIRSGGEDDWQVGVDINGNHYQSQWNWWNSVLDADICFATGGTNCAVGNGGYESNYEGWTASYLPGPTPTYDAAVDWMSHMGYEPGCGLRVLMGTVSNSTRTRNFIDAMARVDSIGCKVDFIHGTQDAASWISEYVDGRFEVEYQHSMHAKMILWQGLYKGNHESYAWVGSMNVTNNAIQNNDETMVRIKGMTEFTAFWNFFQHVEWDD